MHLFLVYVFFFWAVYFKNSWVIFSDTLYKKPTVTYDRMT